MILVDNRIGSADLVEPLKKTGLDVLLTRLESADCAFEGKGIGGLPIDIGIELKKLSTSDLVDSLRSGRLSGEQLPKMLGSQGAYEYGWLLIEGQWRTGRNGLIEVLKERKHSKPIWEVVHGNMLASEMQKHILTLEVCGGLHVRFTPTRRDTVQFIHNLYRWFTDKPLDKHTSHLTAHTPQSFLAVSDFRAAVQRWPCIGPRTSLAVEQIFRGSIMLASHATVDEWANILTTDHKGKQRRLGSKDAERIWKFCRGID